MARDKNLVSSGNTKQVWRVCAHDLGTKTQASFQRGRPVIEDESDDLDASDAKSESDSGNEYELQELIEDRVILTHWVTRGKVQYPPLHVRNDELCWTRSSDELTPIAEEHEGYMGNYGNTLDRQYCRAAVVVWPKNMHLRTLFRMDEATGMGELLSLARVDPKAAAQEAMTIFDTLWPDTPRLTSSESLSATLNLLLLLDDRSLSTRALAAFRIDAVNLLTTKVPQLSNES